VESTQLETLVQEKHEALRSYREAEPGSDTEKKSWDGFYGASKTIDEEVVRLAKDREDDEARARTEALTRSDPVVSLNKEKAKFNRHIFDLITGKRHDELSFAHPELRTDYPMTTDTGDTADYAFYNIKTELWNQLSVHENAESAVKSAGPKVIRTAGDHPIDIPHLSTDAIADTSPGSEVTAPTHAMYPVFTKTTLNSYRVQGFMTVSEEMLRTPDYPFYDVLADIAGRALAVQEATYLAYGTGSTQPKGLGYCGTSAATAASQTTFTMDELLSVYYAPVQGVRRRGQWFLSTYAMLELAKLKNGVSDYLWQPSMQAGQPDLLFGKPINEEAYLVGSTITTGEKHVFFGDISKFWVRYAGNLDIGASKEMRFNEWEVVIRAALWMDCDMPDAVAMYYLTQA